MNKIKILIVSLFLGLASLSFVNSAIAAPETTKQYVSNSAITTAVKADLLANLDMKSLHIKVKTVKNGVVILSGVVDSNDQKEKAGTVATAAKGVTSVLNKIKVKSEKNS